MSSSSSAKSKSKKLNFVSLLRKINNTIESFNGLLPNTETEPESEIPYSIERDKNFNEMTRMNKRDVKEQVEDLEQAYEELSDSLDHFYDALEKVKRYFSEEEEESVDDDEMAEQYWKQKQRRIEDTDYD